jgi:signal transduction histidine kinase
LEDVDAVVTISPALVEPLMSAITNEAEARPEAQVFHLPRSEQSMQAERERITNELARELHDQVAQYLTGLLVQTEVFMREQRNQPEVVDQLAFVRTTVREVLNNVRQILCDLRGEPGLGKNLVKALTEGLFPTCQSQMGMKVSLWASRSWPASLPQESSIHIYRIIQEALTNAHKHGGAASVQVALKASAERLVVSIRDDGRGIAWLDEQKPIGMGLVGMRERAALCGGVLSIRSRPRAGTTITVSIPREALRWSPKHVLPAS